MTREELEKEAEEYACTISEGPTARHTLAYQAHVVGAESRQSEIDKACELIKAFIDTEDGSAKYYELLNDAEQFLKELDK